MAGKRYDSQWKEVTDINGYAMLLVYVLSAVRGIGFLVVTWTTVVLLGGFVSMVDKEDFSRLTLITLIQILWINASFLERIRSAVDIFSSVNAVKSFLTFNWKQDDNARGDQPELPIVKRVAAAKHVVIGWVLALVQSVLLHFFLFFVMCLLIFGLLITTFLSIIGLMDRNHYGDKDESRINMDPAHKVLYVLCVAQGVLFIYRFVLLLLTNEIVSQAYGFKDGGRAVSGYLAKTLTDYSKKISSPGERNLITYAIELMESKSPRSFLSGIQILDRLLTRQPSDKIKAPTLIQQKEENQQHQQNLHLQETNGVPAAKRDKKKKKKEDTKEERNRKMEAWKKEKEKKVERKKWGNKKWANDMMKMLGNKRWTNEMMKMCENHMQTEEEIIVQQLRVIRRLIASASSTHILQKMLDTLNSKRSHDKKMREATARIVEHVADRISLEQFPRGIQCISSLINSFEEYRRLQPYYYHSSSLSTNETTTTSPTSPNRKKGDDEEQGSSSTAPSESESESESEYSESDSDSNDNQSSSKALHSYKDVVMTGLRILWSLTGSEDNCLIISKTKQLISKIMAPVSCDLVHHAGYSEWSTKVSETSLRVMLRLIMTAKGDTMTDLHKQISSNTKAITTINKIVTCSGCKGGELQMKAMQILTQLCMDETSNRGNLTKMLISIFVNGDSSNGSIRNTAGKTLVVLLLSSKSITSLLPNEENNEFVGNLAKILMQVGDNETCRRCAAKILERLCIHHAENNQHLSTLKNTMTGVIPKVLQELLSGSTGEKENPVYATLGTDVESQDTINNNKKNNNHTSSYTRQNKNHKLQVALLSLCAAACDKLHLDLDTISLGEEGDKDRDQGEFVTFSLAMKIVQLNRDLITSDNLKAMKLITRMLIPAMKKLRDHGTVIKRDDLQRLMDTLSSISETMLDLEGCMVFASGTTTLPASPDTFDSLVKQAQELYGKIKVQDSEIVPASYLS